MSVTKETPSLGKFVSIYEDIPQEFSTETDVDSNFYHKIFDIFQSQHRMTPVSKGSNKKSLAFKLLQFCNLKPQQRYILQKEEKIAKKNSVIWLTVLVNFS